MLFSRLIILSILLSSTLNDLSKDKSIFISPVKIPLLLSANFGELRIDHFHSGLDIKTQGVTGKEVVASADGYIYRISVTPGGFGKALYIRHASGYSTVYGHLERFTSEIDDYVKAYQYEKKSYSVTLFPAIEEFHVKQGEVIAYSGNSGGSAGPHLHYEIRKSESEIPINPLRFNLGVIDNIPPVIDKLVIYPVNRYTLIDKKNVSKKIIVTGGRGEYSITPENEISISGSAGFGIKAYDLLNDADNKCAVYSIELLIDSMSIFKYVMDGFSFGESRYINSHIDYEAYMKETIYIERAFVLPDDKLSVYKNVRNRGIFNFCDDKVHKAQILVTDVNDNKSSLTFSIKSDSEKPQLEAGVIDKDLKMMPYNRTNKFTSDNISLIIPSGALYDTLYFSYKNEKGTNEMFSDLHFIHNKFTPVHKACNLSIKPFLIPAGKGSKMLIVQLDDDQKKIAMNSSWSDGYLTADVLSFGRFYIGIDTVPPAIFANGLVQDANLTGKKELRIKVTDDLSGIKTYEPAIDGNWALFEYDQKNDLLIYRFDEKHITRGSRHNLVLRVTDNINNVSTFKCDFVW